MATDQTDGAPPSRGSTILANMGCTANRSAALRKIAATKVASSSAGRKATRLRGAGRSAMPSG